MATFILKKLLALVPLVLGVSLVCFALMHAVPGGPLGALAENPKVSADDLARIRANFGLEEPLPIQYGRWLGRVLLHGDLGRSYVTGEPVLAMIARRIPATVLLVGSAFALALLAAIAIGTTMALRANSGMDTAVGFVMLAIVSIPVFWLGLVGVMFFSVKLGLLPSAGMRTPGEAYSLVDQLRHLALPSGVLAIVFTAGWSRYVRANMGEVLKSDFMQTARAKGMSELGAALVHGMRNAAAPLVTVVALSLPLVFTGSVIVETLFAWPGMGRLFYEGLLHADYPRLMGIVLITSALIALANLFADVIYGLLDPRIRYATNPD